MVTSLIACAMCIARVKASGAMTSWPSLNWRLAATVTQVGVAGALAVAVDGALHVARAGPHGGDGVGGGAAGVVVAVRAHAGTGGGDDVGDDVLDLVREHAAVGVAQHDHLGARLVRGADHGRARSRGRGASRRRSARSRGRRVAPPPRDGSPCHAPWRGSRRESCAARARRGRCATWRRGTRPRHRSRAGPARAGRSRRSHRPDESRRRPRAWRSAGPARSGRARRTRCPWGSLPASPPR